MQTILDELTHNKGGLTGISSEGKKELQKLQNKFSKVTKLFLHCVDKNGNAVTDMSGAKEVVEKVFPRISKVRFQTVFQEVVSSSIEDQIVEETEIPGVRIAAQAIKEDGKTEYIWLVLGVIEGETSEELEDSSCFVTERELYHGLELLREISLQLVRLDMKFKNAQAENLRSQFSAKEMSESLKRIAAVTEVVQLLESEDSVEEILHKILSIAGNFLKISSAQVFQIHEETMDVLTEWLAEGKISFFDQTRNLKRISMLYNDKLNVISSDTKLSADEREFLKSAHVMGTVIAPIRLNGKVGMYVCFNECVGSRVWEVPDVKFIGNAVNIIQSVLVRRIQKNSLASSYAALEAVLDNSGSAIYVKDKQSNSMLFANRILKSIFEKELEEDTFLPMIESAIVSDKQGNSYEVYHAAKGYWYDLYYTTIRWVDGREAVLYALYDITDKKVYQKKIEQQAYTDFLTGLYNRLCCERDLAWQVDEARKSGTKGGLLYLDLDDFKHINDGLGHQYGDILLKAIAHSFQRIHGISNSCYRMGGDEFVIIIPPENHARFQEIVEEIRNIFSRPWFLRDGDYYCTMSMGVVTFPDEGESVQELIKKADIAMYEAKKSGKNRMAQYTDGIKSTSNKRLDMEKNMRNATVEGFKEFEVYYQPIIDTRGEKPLCSGAEALIRWNSDTLGFISPADFIPLAEYLGLINPIGTHVLMEACRTCRVWNESGYPNYKVNVNLSVVQLLQTDIVEIVENALKETGIRPSNLTLEVTESLAINDMERMKTILGRIKKLGVRIALDDFGTGYSSLNHIREIPLDVIKIDQTFVKDLDKDSYSQAFIKMVAELADAIDVNICVEGIETKSQYEILEGMNVSLIQGFYFDKPMPREQFEAKYLQPLKGVANE